MDMLMLKILALAVACLPAPGSEDAYNEAYPDMATDWSKVTEFEFRVYLKGEFKGCVAMNSYVGGYCEYCHRTNHTTDEHRVLYPNALYVD